MNFSYKLHPLIQEDYNEAYEWYEDQQKGLGERFVKAVRSKISEILVNPEVYGSKGNKKFREAQVEYFPCSNKRKLFPEGELKCFCKQKSVQLGNHFFKITFL